MKMGIFIERDGVLNEVRVERNHQVTPLTVDNFKVRTELMEPLTQLKSAGFTLVVTTNQPGLSRGYQSRGQLDRMHAMLRKALPIDDILVCPHDETDHCPCRKPKPGLLVEAGYNWHLNMDCSFVISDKWQDAEAARAAGCTSVLVQSPWVGTVHRDFLVPDFASAVEKILQLRTADRLLAF